MKFEISEIILNKLDLFFVVIDIDMNIILYESKLLDYLDFGSSEDSFSLTDLFPEIFGIEPEITAILQGGREDLKLAEIGRSGESEVYFNMLFYPYKSKNVLIIIEDITREAQFRKSLQQNRNEISILQGELMAKNSDLENSNLQLNTVHQELRTLNAHLEEKIIYRTKEIELSNQRLNRLLDQTVTSLSRALEKRDEYTAGHQQRVAVLSCAIAREMGFDKDMIEGIRFAAKLHDIGKIYVPIDFLTKPGKLTEEEFAIIKSHSKVGFEILKDIESPWPLASIVLQHHERLDGTGYPYGLEGDEIMIQAKILSVADVVEAMATDRPYRLSPGIDKALEVISSNKGKYYDPSIVDICVDLITNKNFSFEDTGGI